MIENDNTEKKNWFKEHFDTIVILGSIGSMFLWLDNKMDSRFLQIDSRFSKIESKLNDIQLKVNTIETVLIIKGIMPTGLATTKKDEA